MLTQYPFEERKLPNHMVFDEFPAFASENE